MGYGWVSGGYVFLGGLFLVGGNSCFFGDGFSGVLWLLLGAGYLADPEDDSCVEECGFFSGWVWINFVNIALT